MRVLVAGAAGQLGSAVARHLGDRGVVALTHADLDITDAGQIRTAVTRYWPDVVVNCAAYTRVDGAESEPDRAMLVNAEGVRLLARACELAGTVLVHFSTDYVFDGTKAAAYTVADEPHPINTYGLSKLRGEEYARRYASRSYVIRTSWLYGRGNGNFVETMLSAGSHRREIHVVTDQQGAPTLADDVAAAAMDLVRTGRYGLYHITNQGSTSWFEFARAIFRKAGRDVAVTPTTSAELTLPAHRPQNSVLDPHPLKETIGYLLPPWEHALDRYLQQRVMHPA